MRIIVGLGNPGDEYKFTRHNLGFLVLDELVIRWTGKFKLSGELRSEIFKKNNFILSKPQAFVNLSGVPVKKILLKYSVPPEDLLVVCDDFSLVLGRLKLKPKGSSGGHNGLESIIQCLGTENFSRLRLGIGPVPVGTDPKDFVLGNFTDEEKNTVKDMVSRAVQAVERIIEIGLEKTMEIVNSVR